MLVFPLLLVLSFAAPADPATVVRQFLLAETGGDRAGAAALWISPEQAFTPREIHRIEKRCAQMAAMTIDVTSIDELQATMETRQTVAVSGRLETSHSRFVLKRTSAGWRIASRDSLEAALVERLKTAQDTAERRRLLASSIDLQNETFVRLCSELVRLFVNQRRLDEAEELARMTDDVARTIGDPASIAEITSVRSIVERYAKKGHSDLAIELGNEAVSYAAAAGDEETLARALVRLARAKQERDGRFDVSLLERTLEIAERLEDPSPAAQAAALLSQQREGEWRRREAFRYAELASRYAEASEDVSAKIFAAQMLGAAYLWNADDELARRHFQRAYDLALAAGYVQIAAQSLGSFVTTLDNTEGAAVIERGLKQFRPPHSLPLLFERVRLDMAAGHPDTAERHLRELLEIAPSNSVGALDMALRFASIRMAQQRFDEAAQYLAEARRLTAAADYNIVPFEATLLRCLGRGQEGIDKMEQRMAMERSSDNASIADPRAAPFVDTMGADEELLLELHVEQGHLLRALEISESVKASSLRAALADGGVAAAVMDDADRRHERDLETRIQQLNRALMTAADEKTSAALSADLDKARSNLLDFRQRALALQPLRNESDTAERPGVDDLPSSLDDLTILSYAQTSDELIVFLIEPKRHGRRAVSARVVPVTSRAMGQKIARFTSFIEQRNLRADELGEELYALLLSPFEKAVLDARVLCIIPHRSLWRVPFHALIGKNGRHLIDAVPVFYAPSVAVLAEAQTRSGRASGPPALLAYANPTVAEKTAALYRAFDRNAPLGAIPETEWEVHAIARLYDKNRARVHIGREADEETIKREAPRYDVLHIATHGLVQENAPMFSALLLSSDSREDEDGLLEAREIVGLDLHAGTVVLSACDSGRSGDDGRRAPVIGFSWAFLAAGCRTTVVSQWKAQSAATAKLMVEFHRRLTHGVSETEALRGAQLALRRDPRYRHPFYWAPFIVVGAP